MTDYAAQLKKLRELEPNWDSYGGIPGDPNTLAAACIFLEAIAAGEVALVPLADGGVQIEYHGKGFNVEVEFEPRKEGEPYGNTMGIWERK